MTSTQCEPGVTLFWGNTYYCHCACHQKSLAYGDSRHFQNISVISWLSVLLVEETGVPRETTDRRKSLTNFITECYIDYTSPTISGDRRILHIITLHVRNFHYN